MEDHAEKEARAHLESVRTMVERLEHAAILDCECDECGDTDSRHDYHDEDKAREAIIEDALDVQVRSGWESMSQFYENEEGLAPQSFSILLCTGGPAVRIVGKLENGYPTRAQIEYQDWGTPWTRLSGLSREDEQALLTYSQCFYFGQ